MKQHKIVFGLIVIPSEIADFILIVDALYELDKLYKPQQWEYK